MLRRENLIADPLLDALRTATRWERAAIVAGWLCFAAAAISTLAFGLSGGDWARPGN